MSSKKDRHNDGAGAKKRRIDRLPKNLPFAPLVRRPDYQLRRVKLSVPKKIPTNIILACVLLGLFFIFAGGFANLAQDELNAFGTDVYDNPITIYPEGLDHQFLYEGIAAGTLMFVGAFGFFLIDRASKYAYSPKHAIISLVVGMGLIIAALFPIMYMLLTKLDLWKLLFPGAI